MIGTIVNTAAIALGGLIGLLIKRGVPKHVEEAVMSSLGIGILIVALNGVIGSMFTAQPTGKLSDSGGLLLIISLAVGTLIGELLRIDDRLNHVGRMIETKLKIDGFAKGFISASLIFCVGAMSIIGPLNDGLRGDASVLFIKSALDGTTALILASTLGVGVLFSAIPVLVYQGTIALLAGVLTKVVSDDLMSMICMVGYAIVLCIGLNFIDSSKIKTANLLPALLVPIVYNMLMMLKTL
ncbi:DUF554 domain-containing protein [Hydrogenoanaerobacterium sp.]|uniref:DUF554 domain-containing protein n=1 Tax=Hydrogenoanaerobacterium sp. TaxID=2953763 RepID=UPI002898A169|nr:DUF554 domain-containing protein [Hydrogenoanaerobacterium sp.]